MTLTRDELLSADVIQRIRVAIVSILDRHPDIVTLTQRPSQNIVPFKDGADVTFPVIVYTHVVTSELASDGDTRSAQFQFTAYALEGQEDVCNALLAVVERAFDGPALQSLPAPIDAYVTQRMRRTIGADDGTERADMDVTLRVYQPVSA